VDRRTFGRSAFWLALAGRLSRAAAESPQSPGGSEQERRPGTPGGLEQQRKQETPRSSFNEHSTAEEVTAGLNLAGMTAVVTGCNSGLGLETMRVLALRGAHVIGTARTIEKGREACASVKGKTTPVVLELTDFDSVVACAAEIQKMNVSVDMLILNAGIVLRRLEQVNGLEKQFVVNHLGHFILTNRLLDRVKAARQGRVVTVGSGIHQRAPEGGIQFDDLSGKSWSESAYEHSKLANGLFSLELSKRLRGTRATSNCVSPGLVRTNLSRNIDASKLPPRKPVEEGAATICYAATSPALAKTTGEYFSDCNPAPQSAYQKDAAMAAKLWDVSTELTRKYLIA
jgi:NAD(P)-dependent dehydrogenase (short-subunit alcohol dehydrogenase family)